MAFIAPTHTARHFHLFLPSNYLCRQRGRDFVPRKGIDENASYWRSVCNLDRLQLPSATAWGGGNVHLIGLLLQNCSPHSD
jgi:hypothetical protein